MKIQGSTAPYPHAADAHGRVNYFRQNSSLTWVWHSVVEEMKIICRIICDKRLSIKDVRSQGKGLRTRGEEVSFS